MNTTRLTAALAASALLAGLLSACDTTIDRAVPAAIASTTATVSATPTKAPPKAGDYVKYMNEIEAGEAVGLVGYNDWETGKTILIDPDKPLPKAVKKMIAKPIHALIKKYGKSKTGSGSSVIHQRARNDAGAASEATRRHVLILASSYGGLGDYTIRWGTVFTVSQPTGKDTGVGRASVSFSHDETLAKAKAWIKKQKHPSKWDIVDATK